MNAMAAATAAQDAKRRRSATSIALWATYANIVLYALCYQLQRPVEPFLVAKLTAAASTSNADHQADAAASIVMYGRVQAFFSAVQTAGSPLVGTLLDHMGIRKTSALVFAASALSYALLARAADVPALFLSKVPTVLQHAFLVAQATAATAATEAGSESDDAAQRAQALGRMTTSYTIGATIGPALGGYLAHKGGMYLGAWLAVVGSIASVVLSLLFLPDDNYHTTTDTDTDTTSSNNPSAGTITARSLSFLADIQRTANLAARPSVWPLLAVKVAGGVARSMHSTALPLALKEGLDFDPAQLGMVLSSASLAVAALGAVALQPSTKALGSVGLARAGLAVRGAMAISMAHIITVASSPSSSSLSGSSWSSKSSGPAFIRVCAASIAHALSSHALATSLTTLTTGAVPPSERGAMLGLEHGLFSFVGVFAPAAGTALLAWGGGFGAVALVNAAIDGALVGGLCAWTRRRSSLVGKSGSRITKDKHKDL